MKKNNNNRFNMDLRLPVTILKLYLQRLNNISN